MDHGKIGWKVVDWVHLSQNRYQWWAIMNMVLVTRVSSYIKGGNF
jgi:hypothetical protein